MMFDLFTFPLSELKLGFSCPLPLSVHTVTLHLLKMAEAPPRPCRFFCHRCSAEVTPRLPDYTCPRCDSGFIEELPEERSFENRSASTSSSSDQNRQSFENMDHQHLFTFPTGYGPFALGIFDDNFDLRSRLPSEDNREAENRREREMASRQRYSARQPRGRYFPRRQGTRHEGVPTLEGIIQQLVNGIIAPTAMPNIGMGSWQVEEQLSHFCTFVVHFNYHFFLFDFFIFRGMLHSNPMDYAWGANGLDAIITQLLNQFENTGPPPADRERIKSLPTITITQEHISAGLECPVCKEDYSVDERVRQLPCNHLFHNDCIVPWLEQVCMSSIDASHCSATKLVYNPSVTTFCWSLPGVQLLLLMPTCGITCRSSFPDSTIPVPCAGRV
ncbi:E3 ubiquitin-protein ligase RNF126 [Oryzias melastigma]|uniref:RING-type E3 ubiquitin transferase n=1 Tax=Oryzias melastigma TaxID=30732 RepID=A0A834F8J9_ORYME|nr:E3 ubiquitin-protein ligase RNF126 [Oryzias melastigma]